MKVHTSTSESGNGTTSEEASVDGDIDGDLNISLQSTDMEHSAEHSKVSSSVYLSQDPSPAPPPALSPVLSHALSQTKPACSPATSLSSSPSIVKKTPSTTEVPHAPPPTLPSVPTWSGFKICGDNIDKHVHRRHIRSDQQNKTLHYFHSYSVKDRINLHDVSDAGPQKPSTIPEVLNKVEPDAQENAVIVDACAILLSRMMCDSMQYFMENYGGVVQRHTPHKYKHEIASKSEVVCEYSLPLFFHLFKII